MQNYSFILEYSL